MGPILYITTRYPSLTLTFVYRETEVLRKAGYDILTVSMGRPPRHTVSREARPLLETTHYLDQVHLFKKLLSQWVIFRLAPRKWLGLFRLALGEKEIITFKDRLRILYHFIEAGYLYTQLKNKNIRHIHAHFLTGPTTISLFLSRYLGIPFSFTMHASNIFIDHHMLKTKLDHCKHAITISAYNRDYLIRKYGNRYSQKIKIIHCGINPKQFHPMDTKQPTPPVILSVGQLAERKGMRYVVEACRILKHRSIPFQCRIIGNGDGMALLREMVNRFQMNDAVFLLGRQPQEIVLEELRQAAVFVLPSIITDFGGREGIPVALMEAMSMQIPVVTTNTVGIPELVEDGKEGLLVAQKNAPALAEALGSLLTQEEKRKVMGRHGRDKIIKKFNIDRVPALFRDTFNG